MALEIRDYRADDRDRMWLAICLAELQMHLAEVDPQKLIKAEGIPAEQLVAGVLTTMAQLGIIIFAEVDGELAGLATGHVHTPKKQVGVARRFGVIDNLVVLPRWRREGVGRALLVAIEGLLADRDCDGGTWLATYCFNQRARAFYEQAGYVPREVQYAKIPQ